jgi:heptosyltransferase-2
MRSLTKDTRLLVWMPRWLGDLQMAEPALAALASHLESAPTLAMPRAYVPLFDTELFHLARGLEHARLVALEDEPAFASALHDHDAVLLLRGSFRSAWRSFRARVPRRIGWARDGRGVLLTDAIRPQREVVPGRRGVLPRPFTTSVEELVGSRGVFVRRTEPRLVPRPALLDKTRVRLAASGLAPGASFILLNAGGRMGSAKALPDWEPIARPLLEAGRTLVAVAGPGEEARLDALTAALAGTGGALVPLRDPVVSLPELAALGALCDLAIGTDGGPRHLFAAAGARQLVLFGPTDPRHTASHLERTDTFVGRVDCGPCHRETCNAAAPLACFAAIDPAAIVHAALS